MDYRRLSPASREAFLVAQSLAVRRGHRELRAQHLLLSLVRSAGDLEAAVLEAQGVGTEELRSALESLLEREPAEYSRTTGVSMDLDRVLDAAEREADTRGSGDVTPRHLLAGLLQAAGPASELLRERGVTTAGLFDALPAPRAQFAPSSKGTRFRDLTAEATAGKLGPIVGRDAETARLVETLLRGSHHPVLLGEEGVGRSAIVEGLAKTLAGSGAPFALRGARVVAVDPSSLGEQLQSWVRKWQGRTSRLLLHIADSRALAQAIREVRASGDVWAVTFIGCATAAEYYGSLSRQPYLAGSVETLAVEPLSTQATRLVLRGIRSRIEKQNDVELREDTIEAAVDLASRFLSGTKLPGAAIRVLEEAAKSRRGERRRVPAELERAEEKVLQLQSQRERSARTESELAELRTAAGWLRARWEQEVEAKERVRGWRRQLDECEDERLRRRLLEAEAALPDADAELVDEDVSAEDVARVVEKRAGVHLGGILLDSRTKLVKLEKNLGNDVLGQRDAVRAIVSTLMRSASRIGSSSASGTSFLFLGPSGVGKTEAGRSLARHFLGNEAAFTIARGDDPRTILASLACGPRSVVLVRDVECASSGSIRLLKRILEEGLIRDSAGRVFDFRQAILVLCARESSTLSARVDAVVEFRTLSRDIVRLLVDRHCRALSDRLAERGVELEWTPPAWEWIAERGWSREEGLHRLHRILSDEVGAHLGRMLVLGELGRGSRARVDAREGRLDVSLAQESPSSSGSLPALPGASASCSRAG